jgi:formylglycine-generating enzyme
MHSGNLSRWLVLTASWLSAACARNSSSNESEIGIGSGGNTDTGGSSTMTGATNAGTSSSSGTPSSSGGSNMGGTAGTAASSTPPSCKASGLGRTDCGPTEESCCTSIQVPGGTYYRTYTNDGSGVKATADPATVSDFRLDKYLVTVGRYRMFLAAWNGGSGYTPSIGSGKHAYLNGGKGLADSGASGSYETGWTESDNDNLSPTGDNLACKTDGATFTDSPGGNEQLPINCVNWWEAYAFCIWDGGFLPSEAEYAYTAAGGSEQRRYPWGSQDPGNGNQYAIYGCNYPNGPGTCSGITNIAPVGTAKLGVGRWGHLDLVGNLTEWNLDWFAPSYVNPCTDCANVADGSGKVVRDGYFASGDSTLLVSYRNSLYPTNRFNSFGFRCARAP